MFRASWLANWLQTGGLSAPEDGNVCRGRGPGVAEGGCVGGAEEMVLKELPRGRACPSSGSGRP